MKKLLSKFNGGYKVQNPLMLVVSAVFVIACTILISALVGPVLGLTTAGIVIFGPSVNDKYGKTGAEIDSHNAYGHYTRGYKIPSSLSERQSTVRQTLSIVSKLWKTAAVDRQSFVNYSESHPYVKRGRTIKLRANAWFCEFNIVARLMGRSTPVLNAPTSDTTFPIITGLSAAVESSPASVTIEPIKTGVYPTGCKILIYASSPQSAGVMSYKTPQYNFIGAFDATITPAIDITSEYEAVNGVITDDNDGQSVWFETCLAMPTGEQTIRQRTNVVVITAA